MDLGKRGALFSRDLGRPLEREKGEREDWVERKSGRVGVSVMGAGVGKREEGSEGKRGWGVFVSNGVVLVMWITWENDSIRL